MYILLVLLLYIIAYINVYTSHVKFRFKTWNTTFVWATSIRRIATFESFLRDSLNHEVGGRRFFCNSGTYLTNAETEKTVILVHLTLITQYPSISIFLIDLVILFLPDVMGHGKGCSSVKEDLDDLVVIAMGC